MITSRRLRAFSLLCAMLVWSHVAIAAPIQGSEELLYFGSMGQGNAGVTYVNPNLGPYNPYSVAVGPNACVPTAFANGMTYLENYNNFVLDIPSPFTTSPNAYAQVNNIAAAMGTFNTTNNGANGWTDLGGTYVPGMFNGAVSYLSNTGSNPAPTVTVSGQYSPAMPAGFSRTSINNAAPGTYNAGTNAVAQTPTPQYIASALNNNNAVMIGVQWGSYDENDVWTAAGGGHELTVTSIYVDGNSGFIGLLDPWGDAPFAQSDAGTVSPTISMVNGFMYLTWPITWTSDGGFNPDDGFGSDGQTGRIVTDTILAVPEPGSAMVIAFASVILVIRRRRIGEAA